MKVIQYSKWIGLPLSIRAKIAHKFGIAKVRSTSVINNTVVDDGYDVHAVENTLSIEAMQNYMHSKETDANLLLEELAHFIDNPIVHPEVKVDVEVKEEIKEQAKEAPKKKAVKKAEK